eukprot:TRINITY_DN184_c0_g3_i2.p1 TRINITY_DN184_c0_g3~~TRINITY_DN184_c0_g3_i2.p1  ORF type:complete len:210 (+),score=52.68 TRINITY_DN184_c0_g3_i2:108-737(+)
MYLGRLTNRIIFRTKVIANNNLKSYKNCSLINNNVENSSLINNLYSTNVKLNQSGLFLNNGKYNNIKNENKYLNKILYKQSFSKTDIDLHGSKNKNAETVKVTWKDKDGNLTEVNARIGDSLLEVAHSNGINLEGACEGSLACSTCHVILEDEIFDMLEEPCDEEEDMLDLAFGLTETSRLGCQVIITKELEGIIIELPSATRNMAVDG